MGYLDEEDFNDPLHGAIGETAAEANMLIDVSVSSDVNGLCNWLGNKSTG